jgi:hypothetical protein
MGVNMETIKLWVLEYKVGKTAGYLTHSGSMSLNKKAAIKFKTRENAIAHRDTNGPTMWMYLPAEFEFNQDDLENNYFSRYFS